MAGQTTLHGFCFGSCLAPALTFLTDGLGSGSESHVSPSSPLSCFVHGVYHSNRKAKQDTRITESCDSSTHSWLRLSAVCSTSAIIIIIIIIHGLCSCLNEKHSLQQYWAFEFSVSSWAWWLGKVRWFSPAWRKDATEGNRLCC